MSDPEVTEEQSTTSVVPRPNIEGTIAAMKAFEELKQKVLNANDSIMIQGKSYIKRSGWQKIAMALGISTEIVSIKREQVGDVWIVEVVARAKTPLGRISENVAVCDSIEFRKGALQDTLHNIESKATTRAKDRAISDLVGGGQVTAEEILQGPEVEIKEAQDTKETHKESPKEPKDLITTKQYNYLQMLMKDEQVKQFVEKQLNGRKLGEISKDEASDIIDEVLEM